MNELKYTRPMRLVRTMADAPTATSPTGIILEGVDQSAKLLYALANRVRADNVETKDSTNSDSTSCHLCGEPAEAVELDDGSTGYWCDGKQSESRHGIAMVGWQSPKEAA